MADVARGQQVSNLVIPGSPKLIGRCLKIPEASPRSSPRRIPEGSRPAILRQQSSSALRSPQPPGPLTQLTLRQSASSNNFVRRQESTGLMNTAPMAASVSTKSLSVSAPVGPLPHRGSTASLGMLSRGQGVGAPQSSYANILSLSPPRDATRSCASSSPPPARPSKSSPLPGSANRLPCQVLPFPVSVATNSARSSGKPVEAGFMPPSPLLGTRLDNSSAVPPKIAKASAPRLIFSASSSSLPKVTPVRSFSSRTECQTPQDVVRTSISELSQKQSDHPLSVPLRAQGRLGLGAAARQCRSPAVAANAVQGSFEWNVAQSSSQCSVPSSRTGSYRSVTSTAAQQLPLSSTDRLSRGHPSNGRRFEASADVPDTLVPKLGVALSGGAKTLDRPCAIRTSPALRPGRKRSRSEPLSPEGVSSAEPESVSPPRSCVLPSDGASIETTSAVVSNVVAVAFGADEADSIVQKSGAAALLRESRLNEVYEANAATAVNELENFEKAERLPCEAASGVQIPDEGANDKNHAPASRTGIAGLADAVCATAEAPADPDSRADPVLVGDEGGTAKPAAAVDASPRNEARLADASPHSDSPYRTSMPGLGRHTLRPSIATKGSFTEDVTIEVLGADEMSDSSEGSKDGADAIRRAVSRRSSSFLGRMSKDDRRLSVSSSFEVTESFSPAALAEDWNRLKELASLWPLADGEEIPAVSCLGAIHADLCSKCKIPEPDVELNDLPSEHFGQISATLLASRENAANRS